MSKEVPAHRIKFILYQLLNINRWAIANEIAVTTGQNNNNGNTVTTLLYSTLNLLAGNQSKAIESINSTAEQCKNINESKKIRDILNNGQLDIKTLLSLIQSDYLGDDDDQFETYRILTVLCQRANDMEGMTFFLQETLNLKPDFFEAKVSLAFLTLTSSVGNASLSYKAETMFRELYKTHHDSDQVCGGLGRSLWNQGKHEDSIRFLKEAFYKKPDDLNWYDRYEESLLFYERYEDLLEAVQKALEHRPGDQHLIAIKKQTEDYLKSVNKPRIVRFPLRTEELKNLEEAANKFLFNLTVNPKYKIKKDHSILTLGSCFATNIAIALRQYGINAANVTLGEIINSPYANLAYLNRVTGKDLNQTTTKKFINILGRDPVNDRKLFKKANLIIFTLGVAPCAFTKEGEFFLFEPGEFAFKQLNKKYIWRNTSVDENKKCITSIVKILKEIKPDLKVIFTVSPVPLHCTFDYESAFMADCVSKSTLRAAIDEVLREDNKDIMYWPTFELFRWLGPYFENVYGADDGNSTHVSEFAVNIAVKAFYEKFIID